MSTDVLLRSNLLATFPTPFKVVDFEAGPIYSIVKSAPLLRFQTNPTALAEQVDAYPEA
jgi:hypothetical protein